jgi:hypothetical protein
MGSNILSPDVALYLGIGLFLGVTSGLG